MWKVLIKLLGVPLDQQTRNEITLHSDAVSSSKMHYALACYQGVCGCPSRRNSPRIAVWDYLTQSELACRLHDLIIGKFTNQVKRSPKRNFVTATWNICMPMTQQAHAVAGDGTYYLCSQDCLPASVRVISGLLSTWHIFDCQLRCYFHCPNTHQYCKFNKSRELSYWYSIWIIWDFVDLKLTLYR